MSEVYCIKDAPKQNGDLWFKISKKQVVTVMNPASLFWRNRKFTLEDFRKELKNA
jgi:hypothetical protein